MKRNPGQASPLNPDFAAAHPGYLLNLNMQLGEASGAATALLVLRATACHTGMAMFAEAGVSDKPADESAAPQAAE